MLVTIGRCSHACSVSANVTFVRRLARSFGLLVALAVLPRTAFAWQAAQVPLRSYCAARVVALSRVGGSARISPHPGSAPSGPAGKASVWRYELAGDVPEAVSLQLTMQTTKGWYRVAAPIVPLLDDNGRYRSSEATFERTQVHSPAQFFELPFAAGRPKYLWLSKVGDAGATPETRCPAMWIAHTRRGAHKAKHERKGTSMWSALNTVKRLNPSVYNVHAPPPVGVIPQARAIAAPASALSCRHPFRAAVIKDVTPPIYPRAYAENGDRRLVEVDVLVELAPDGSVVGRLLAGPSGDKLFDGNALFAASQSTYLPKIGLCRPVPSYYIFVAEYSPG